MHLHFLFCGEVFVLRRYSGLPEAQEAVQCTAEAALVARFEASDVVEDTGAVGEVREGGAVVLRGERLCAGKELTEARGDDFKFGGPGAPEAPLGGDDLFGEGRLGRNAGAEIGEKFFAEGDEVRMRLGGEDSGG